MTDAIDLTPWPVAKESDLTWELRSRRPDLERVDEVVTPPEVRFVAVTDGHRFSVHALDDLIGIGSLRWLISDPERDDASGRIMWVEVADQYRREGVATALLEAATAYAKHYDLPVPRHSETRTPSGEAWARSLGASPAREIVEPEP